MNLYKRTFTLVLSLQLLFNVTFAQDFSPKRVIIFRPDREGIAGRLVDVQADRIIVLAGGLEESIPLTDIRRLILTTQSSGGVGIAYGAILGGYAGMHLVGTSRGSGSFVTHRDWSSGALYLLLVPAVAVGAGIGYLLDPGSSEKEELFDFTGDQTSRTNTQRGLQDVFRAGSGVRKFHVYFQGSQISQGMPPLNLPSSYGSDTYYSDITNFNLLRRLQMTYSFYPEIETGVALVWLDEPARTSWGYESPAPSTSINYYGHQSLESSAKFGIVAWRPLSSLSNLRMDNLDLKIGAGIGVASVDFNRMTTVSTYDGNNPSQQPVQNFPFGIHEDLMCQYLFAELHFNLGKNLSLALVADKAFLPSRELPAVPEARIPAQQLNLGNSSVGFTIGMHF